MRNFFGKLRTLWAMRKLRKNLGQQYPVNLDWYLLAWHMIGTMNIGQCSPGKCGMCDRITSSCALTLKEWEAQGESTKDHG